MIDSYDVRRIYKFFCCNHYFFIMKRISSFEIFLISWIIINTFTQIYLCTSHIECQEKLKVLSLENLELEISYVTFRDFLTSFWIRVQDLKFIVQSYSSSVIFFKNFKYVFSYINNVYFRDNHKNHSFHILRFDEVFFNPNLSFVSQLWFKLRIRLGN